MVAMVFVEIPADHSRFVCLGALTNRTLPPQHEPTFPTASGLSLLVVDHANLSENPKLPKAFPKLTMEVRHC